MVYSLTGIFNFFPLQDNDDVAQRVVGIIGIVAEAYIEREVLEVMLLESLPECLIQNAAEKH